MYIVDLLTRVFLRKFNKVMLPFNLLKMLNFHKIFEDLIKKNNQPANRVLMNIIKKEVFKPVVMCAFECPKTNS